MRRTLSWGSVALAAAVALAISVSARGARTKRPEAPDHDSTQALAAAANSDTGGSPASAGSCANEGWRGYARPRFPSQKSCELWVRKHVAPSPAIETPPAEKKSGSTEVRTAIPFLA